VLVWPAPRTNSSVLRLMLWDAGSTCTWALALIAGFFTRVAVITVSPGISAVTVPLAYFFNWVVYFTVGTLLPKLHIIDSVYYRFTISAPALAACLLISVICGYLSAELPYWLFTRKSFVQQGTNVKEKSHES